jgi:hypothetical protein
MNRVTQEDRVRTASGARKGGALTLWRSHHFLLPLEEVARAAGLQTGLVEKLVDCGVIEAAPESRTPPLFPPSAVDRLRCAMRLRRDLGVNVAGVAVILDMRERLRSLQAELDWLRRRAKL